MLFLNNARPTYGLSDGRTDPLSLLQSCEDAFKSIMNRNERTINALLVPIPDHHRIVHLIYSWRQKTSRPNPESATSTDDGRKSRLEGGRPPLKIFSSGFPSDRHTPPGDATNSKPNCELNNKPLNMLTSLLEGLSVRRSVRPSVGHAFTIKRVIFDQMSVIMQSRSQYKRYMRLHR